MALRRTPTVIDFYAVEVMKHLLDKKTVNRKNLTKEELSSLVIQSFRIAQTMEEYSNNLIDKSNN